MKFILGALFYLIAFSTTCIAHVDFDYGEVTPLIIALTDAEKKVVAQKTYKVAITDYPPFIYYDIDKQKFDGVAYETLMILSKKTGLKFEFIEYANLQDSINAVREGKADITFSSNFFDETMQKTDSFFSRKAYIVIARSHKLNWTDMFLNANEGPHLTLATVRGSVISKLARNLNVDIRLVEVNTQIEALVRVAIGEADFTLMDLSTFGYYQTKIASNALVLADNSHVFEIMTNFGINKRIDPLMVTVFNKGINSFNTKETEIIEKHWSEYVYKEPIMRSEFFILIVTLLIIVLNNIIWYLAAQWNIKKQERILTDRWMAATSEAIENERKLLTANFEKRLEKINKENENRHKA